ncbi:hypothetical protein [Candidatus Mesenet endosymbiont of Phosphuga atrata]|uniref:hypothetical protein n=1 Tax=Candidatus Mesenet endosymbiont of Phosphuga atrata TaxID=3066221 RepID=UPI0030CA7104
MKKELNYNDQKLNSELDIEEKLKINTEQSEQIIPQFYPNLLEEALQDKDIKLEFTNLIIENPYEYSTVSRL